MSCDWTYEHDTCSWDTECGNKHVFIEGTPIDNSYEFCPYCGDKLNEIVKEPNNDT